MSWYHTVLLLDAVRKPVQGRGVPASSIRPAPSPAIRPPVPEVRR